MRERLYRSRDDRMLFGVAGGLARYLGVDSSLVRIVWVLLFFAAGAGFLLYIVAALVIPEEPAGLGAPGVAGGAAMGTESAPAERRGMADGPIILGVVLILIGGWLLVQRFLPDIDGALIWPGVLLIIGAALVIGSLRGRDRG